MLRVGDKVKIQALADRGQSEFEERIGSVGTVTGNRILDGSTIGYLVEFEDNTVAWFYEKELATA
ncbi:MAG: cytochrome b6f subunit family protein [Synechococcus sp.]